MGGRGEEGTGRGEGEGTERVRAGGGYEESGELGGGRRSRGKNVLEKLHLSSAREITSTLPRAETHSVWSGNKARQKKRKARRKVKT